MSCSTGSRRGSKQTEFSLDSNWIFASPVKIGGLLCSYTGESREFGSMTELFCDFMKRTLAITERQMWDREWPHRASVIVDSHHRLTMDVCIACTMNLAAFAQSASDYIN